METTGRTVVAAITGRTSLADAHDALLKCVTAAPAAPAAVERPSNEGAEIARLERETRVHLKAHLQTLSEAWKTYILHSFEVMHQGMTQFHAEGCDLEDAGGHFVRTKLSECIATVHNAPIPTIARPQDLTDLIVAHRRAYSNAYGTIGTRRLLAMKALFEHKVNTLFNLFADDFITFTARLLRRSLTFHEK
jgi:hypothetical protein